MYLATMYFETNSDLSNVAKEECCIIFLHPCSLYALRDDNKSSSSLDPFMNWIQFCNFMQNPILYYEFRRSALSET